ncbi:glycosyltransferase family 9 protein [Pseudolabrys taiwanensis]|nr:glycosyltransferase family 9 protein [Pseudolabrys taiwanensis]
MTGRIEIGERPRILVIALRRLGDVLLTTPLIRSLRRAWPQARIEALVFADTAGILAGNPDVDAVLTMPSRPSVPQSLALGARLLRRYDLAISTQSGDRPTGFAVAAGRATLAPVEQRLSGILKRALLTRSVPVQRGLHRVEEMLRLADALGIARVAELVPPKPEPFEGAPAGGYAVIHAAPMFRYKQWTKEGWRALAGKLAADGLTVVATGGPAEDERRYLDDLWAGAPVTRFDGRLSWAQLTGLLAGAKVFIGPDTSVTHLAAATGCPTVALFGPTDPRLWAPWPAGGLESPFEAAGTIQQRGNVFLVQHAFPCTPCQLEGCERRLTSYSACLDALGVERVAEAVMRALIARR